MAALLVSLVVFGSALNMAAANWTEVRLTEVLERAEVCGPAFEALARAQKQQRLVEQGEELGRLPTGRVTLAARLNPELTRGGRATLDWQLTDDLSIDLNLPLGTPPVSGSPGPAGTSLAVTWSKRVWPDAGAGLRDQLKILDEQVTALELREQKATALVEVISAFYALRAALQQLELDTRQQALAQGRADHALGRYEQGLIGLRELQTEQSSLHQATAAVDRARRDVRQARERLLSVAGMLEGDTAGCVGELAGALYLIDDIDWSGAVEQIAMLLEVPMFPEAMGMSAPSLEPADRWEEPLLAYSLGYQRARMALISAQLGVVTAEAALRPVVSAEATVQTDLQELDPAWAVGMSIIWDLAADKRVDVQSAALDLEGAQSRLEQTRRSAIDAGRSAWRRVVDATSALARAEDALDEALRTQEVAHRRIEAGLAPAVEREEALLQVDRRRSEVEAARAEWNLAWLALAQQFGVDVVLK